MLLLVYTGSYFTVLGRNPAVPNFPGPFSSSGEWRNHARCPPSIVGDCPPWVKPQEAKEF